MKNIYKSLLLSFAFSSAFIACDSHDNIDVILRDALEELSQSIPDTKASLEKVGFRPVDQKNVLIALPPKVLVYNTEVATEMPSDVASGISMNELFSKVERFAIEDGQRLVKNQQYGGVVGLSAKAQEIQRLALAIAQSKAPDQEGGSRFAQPAVRTIVNTTASLLGRIKCLSDFASQNATNAKAALRSCNVLAATAVLNSISQLTSEMIDLTKENSIESQNKLEKIYQAMQTMYGDSKLEKKSKISHSVDKLLDKTVALKESFEILESSRNTLKIKYADSYLESYAQLAASALDSALMMSDPNLGQKYQTATSQLQDAIIAMNIISFKKNINNPFASYCKKKSGVECIQIMMNDDFDTRSVQVTDFYNQTMALIGDTNELCPQSNLCTDGMELQKTLLSFNLQFIKLQNQTLNMNNQFEMMLKIMKTAHDTIRNTISNIR